MSQENATASATDARLAQLRQALWSADEAVAIVTCGLVRAVLARVEAQRARISELEAALEASHADARREALHNCACLFEVFAENAQARGDTAEWAMAGAMAARVREQLEGEAT